MGRGRTHQGSERPTPQTRPFAARGEHGNRAAASGRVLWVMAELTKTPGLNARHLTARARLCQSLNGEESQGRTDHFRKKRGGGLGIYEIESTKIAIGFGVPSGDGACRAGGITERKKKESLNPAPAGHIARGDIPGTGLGPPCLATCETAS